MTRLDDLFHRPAQTLRDPRLRTWKARLNRPGTTATVEISHPDLGLGLGGDADLHVQFVEDGRELPLESFPWDDELNTGLVELEVRAVDQDQEADRFALGLRAALRRPARDFGDGYFNSVLTDFLRNSDLTQYPELSEALAHSSANAPATDGLRGRESYRVCSDMIADAITDQAHELTNRLHYSEQEAKSILVSAMTRYLDERFSITSRRRLGLL